MNILGILAGFGIDRLPLKMDSGIYAGFFIILGNLIRKFSIEKYILSSDIWGLLFLVIVLVAVAKLNGWVNIANCKCNNAEFFLITTICGTILILIIANYFSKLNKIFKNIVCFIGRYSLAYFMLEGFVAHYLDSFMGVVRLGTGIKQSMLVSIIYCAIIAPFAYVLGKMFDFFTAVALKK